jgi:hypothetical protein
MRGSSRVARRTRVGGGRRTCGEDLPRYAKQQHMPQHCAAATMQVQRWASSLTRFQEQLASEGGGGEWVGRADVVRPTAAYGRAGELRGGVTPTQARSRSRSCGRGGSAVTAWCRLHAALSPAGRHGPGRKTRVRGGGDMRQNAARACFTTRSRRTGSSIGWPVASVSKKRWTS